MPTAPPPFTTPHRLCVFEDPHVAALEPLTLLRPAFELLCGQTDLVSKHYRRFGPCELGALIRPHLAELFALQHPGVPVNDLAWLRAGPTVLVNGRWLPPAEKPAEPPAPCVGVADGEVAFAVVGPDLLASCSRNTLEDCLESWKFRVPVVEAGGKLLRHPWDFVENNAEELAVDHAWLAPCSGPVMETHPFAVVGPPEALFVSLTARVDPMVVADTTKGPVFIGRDAVVTAFTRLEGPCFVGPGTHVLGAKVRAGTTLGPHCRVGGEVEACIIHSHSNKYHEGFLGHSYVGQWVNLGAGTHNSDLRNDYGEVTVTVDGRRVATGLAKVGCFLGDYTRAGLGVLLNTGTNAGAFCNLLPSGSLLPKYVPSFCSWWNGELVDRVDFPKVLDSAARAMQRRGVALTEAHVGLFRVLLDDTAPERRRVLREAEQRRLRRSA
jgi:UDP-N-acetylglucosamine diphosphorylase/glucosamine-1-phosphate N-acetyltransferase